MKKKVLFIFILFTLLSFKYFFSINTEKNNIINCDYLSTDIIHIGYIQNTPIVFLKSDNNVYKYQNACLIKFFEPLSLNLQIIHLNDFYIFYFNKQTKELILCSHQNIIIKTIFIDDNIVSISSDNNIIMYVNNNYVLKKINLQTLEISILHEDVGNVKWFKGFYYSKFIEYPYTVAHLYKFSQDEKEDSLIFNDWYDGIRWDIFNNGVFYLRQAKEIFLLDINNNCRTTINDITLYCNTFYDYKTNTIISYNSTGKDTVSLIDLNKHECFQR